MPRLSFDQLLDIYRHTEFNPDGRGGRLSIASDDILNTLRLLDTDDDAASDGAITLGSDPATLAVGQDVQVAIAAPRLALGIFVHDFDGLLNSPEARIREPRDYFIVEGQFHKGGTPVPPRFAAYRQVLALIALFSEAASYLDQLRQELVFVRNGKFVVPVRYDSALLERVSLQNIARLLNQFSDETHRDQKLEILAESIVQACAAQPVNQRFAFLLENLSALADGVRDGYRLFASSFSYAKIRSELENARIDFVSKINKTVVDIQGQLLGIPVATVIVASELKVASACGLELWTDVAVVAGAWIFLVLLLIAIVNQWLTLDTIAWEIDRQKGQLAKDYADVSVRFMDVFAALTGRIIWYRVGAGVIALIAVAGACFATVAFERVVRVDASACISGKVPMVFPKT